MTELQQWQKDYIEEITAMSNNELLIETMERYADATSDFNNRDIWWRYNISDVRLRMRLVNWLNEGEK